MRFSTIQPNTRKYFSQHFLKCNQTLKNIFLFLKIAFLKNKQFPENHLHETNIALRFYFFYFTLSLFQNTNFGLSILKIYFNIKFIFHHFLLLFQPFLSTFLIATTTSHCHDHHHNQYKTYNGHCHGHHHNHHKAYNIISDMLKQTPNHALHLQQHKQQIHGNLKSNPPYPFKFHIHRNQIHLKSKSKRSTCKERHILTTKSKSLNPQVKQRESKSPNPLIK